MTLKEILAKYPWLENPTTGNVYCPMVDAATGQRKDIDPQEYFEAIVAVYRDKFRTLTKGEAEKAVRDNVGYWAGYYDFGVMEKVKEVYGASHPIYG
jgi:glutamine synthetase